MANGKTNGKGSRNGNDKSLFRPGSTHSSKRADATSIDPVAIGRPPIQVNWELVHRMAMIHCTPSEVAAVMGLHELTLLGHKRFPSVYKHGWEAGKMSLRRMQWLKAREGNTAMLVFLGKNILHQRDYWTGELTGKDGGAIEIADASRPRLEKLSLEELRQLQELVTRATPQLVEAEVIDVEAATK